MKKIYTLSLLALGLFSQAQVSLPHYDGFDYAVGSALQTQTGWTLLNTGDDLAIAAGSLAYAGLPATTGNKVAFGGSGIDASKSFTSQAENTVYYSMLLRVTDLAATTSTTGGYVAGFIQGTTSNFGATLWLKKVDENTFNIGVNPRTTAANTVFGTTNYSINQTYLVVVSYIINAEAANDAVKIWINPTLGGAEPTATASAINTGTDLSAVSQFLVRQGSATDTPNIEIDELRIALSWADVTGGSLAISQNQIQGLKVYPNPVTNGTFYINTNADSTKEVVVYDVLGKQVVKTTTTNAVNVSNLKGGVYIVKITEEGKTATRKLVIK